MIKKKKKKFRKGHRKGKLLKRPEKSLLLFFNTSNINQMPLLLDSSKNHHTAIKYPRVGCAGLVKHGDKILMGVRGKQPNKGKWILPGGGIQPFENLSQVLKREIYEETGLNIEPDKFIGVYEIINPPDEHRIIVYRWANFISGEIKPSSDILDAKFCSREELKEFVRTKKCSEIVEKVLRDVDLV